MAYAKTISLNADETAVVMMALAERRLECRRMVDLSEDNQILIAYWNGAAAETAAIEARLTALEYKEEPQITDEELAALEEEEALEIARELAEEAEWLEEEEERRAMGSERDDEYEYEDRLDRLNYSNED